MKHIRPLAQGRSGKIYCTACLAKADTVADLDAKPCYSDHYDD